MAQPMEMTLVQLETRLAPWVQLEDNKLLGAAADRGPVRLLQSVLRATASPHASARLMHDALILLTFGLRFLEDREREEQAQYGDDRHVTAIQTEDQRQRQREANAAKAASIRSSWRTQRFATQRLGALMLEMPDFLVDGGLEEVDGSPVQTCAEDPAFVTVELDETALRNQVTSCAQALQQREVTKRQEEKEQLRNQQRERRRQEERRRKQLMLKKRRHDNAVRRWQYLVSRMLQRDSQDKAASSTSTSSPAPSEPHPPALARAASMRPANQRASRVFLTDLGRGNSSILYSLRGHPLLERSGAMSIVVHEFVRISIRRGLNRVLCATNMVIDQDSMQSGFPVRNPNDATGGDSRSSHPSRRPLRLGLLLCDLHFGPKYMGLYQRLFARAAQHHYGVSVEWRLFNCIRSQFPTHAHRRVLDGFLVAGGPRSDAPTKTAKPRSPRNSSRNRWRHQLMLLLRHLHQEAKMPLAAVGFGHVLLGEALGASIAEAEWVDGWIPLDQFERAEAMHGRHIKHKHAPPSIRYLHGEYIESFSSAPKGMKIWKSADGCFVTCFRDHMTLSLDGLPECASFVFDTLSELYETDRSTGSTSTRNSTVLASDIADQVPPSSVDSPHKTMDGGLVAARMLLDHFNRRRNAMISSSSNETMHIAAAVGSNDVPDLEASLKHLGATAALQAVWISMDLTADNHLVVLGPRLRMLLAEHARHTRDSCRGSNPNVKLLRRRSSSNDARLSLNDLRSRALLLVDHAISPGESALTSKLPTLGVTSSRSMSESPAFASILPSTTRSNRRPTAPAVKRIVTTSVDVLTLSEALLILRAQQRESDPHPDPELAPNMSTTPRAMGSGSGGSDRPPRVLLELPNLDDPTGQISRSDLQALWLGLLAVLRISALMDTEFSLVSRQANVLGYLHRKRPMWRLIHDCRTSGTTGAGTCNANCTSTASSVSMTPFSIAKVARGAAHADAVLLDHAQILGNSAQENALLVQHARACGLEIWVDAQESNETSGNLGSSAGLVASKMLHERVAAASRVPLAKDMEATKVQEVEVMLLKLTGVQGIVTSCPEIAVGALAQLHERGAAVQQVEAIFAKWQANDKSRARALQSAASAAEREDEHLEKDDEELQDDASSADEHAIVDEIARQWREHGVRRPLSVPFIPLRPLPPKRGDQVVGPRLGSSHPTRLVGAIQRRVRHIGSLRAASSSRMSSPT